MTVAEVQNEEQGRDLSGRRVVIIGGTGSVGRASCAPG
ncbi:FlaA1/EpsC-like NDP-sugar epimerase [Leucobacter exalbidus]|uniref:FlaA1/EpsC-like NDP-sugar epimerase n=1 Tax=Leucobacter exalbidus TaxID=662960 RepID=A0A940PLX1_9MICO|nr:FlaA1/EpsC-like NDP-sugar epimerase [Leucobacter exalbidus]